MRPDSAALRRALRKRPSVVLRRAATEARQELDRVNLRRHAGGRGPLRLDRIVPGGTAAAEKATARAVGEIADWKAALTAASVDTAWRQRIEARASAALAGEHELFGDAPARLSHPPDWLADVHSGHRWPPGYYRSLDYLNSGRRSDVKVPWELSRLRHLVALAQAAALGDGLAYARFEGDLEDWRQRNPLGWSINWTCAMEVALRAVNLICADAILLASDERAHRRGALVAMLYQHGWFLARNLEISELNGNHFLADAVGLVWLGRYFEGIGDGEEWLERGCAMTDEAASEQILPDGLDHEGSPAYHVLVLELFLAARAAAGPRLTAIDPTLRAMTDATLAFTGPDGRVPNLGDDDGGRALALSDTASRDARRVLALAAALLDHPAASREAGPEHYEDACWLIDRGPPPASVPPRRGAVLASGGLAVLGGGGDHIVVDLGPIGFRGRGGHGHVDAMSFEATLGGRLCVRDSGTATYTGDPGLRNRLRDVWAHSLIVIDGLPYACVGDTTRLWAIDGDSLPEVLAFDLAPDRHELRLRQTLPAQDGSADHERWLRWTPGELLLEDVVRAPAGARIDALLQLPPGTVQTSGGLQTPDHEYELEEAPPAATMTTQAVPWSEGYGSLGEGCRATLTATAGPVPFTVRWRLHPR